MVMARAKDVLSQVVPVPVPFQVPDVPSQVIDIRAEGDAIIVVKGFAGLANM